MLLLLLEQNFLFEQVKILIGLNVDIVICYDNDISINHIRSECEKFYKVRRVYYMYDKWDILDKKENASDKGLKIFNFMLKNKIKYDEREHNKYIEYLKNSKKGK